MKPGKLRSVIRHELLTIIGQPSFWITLMSIPLITAIVFAISYFSSQSEKKLEVNEPSSYHISIVDHSGFISPQIVAKTGLTMSNDEQKSREQVSRGEIDGLIVYPQDIAKTRAYRVYVDTSDGDSSRGAMVSELGNQLLRYSLLEPLGDAALIRLALEGATSDTVSYKDGEASAGFSSYIVPGTFLVLFYFALIMSVGYALTSVSEEKENRAIEMVLSYVNPRTLMTGKLISVTLVTLIQFLTYIIVGVSAYFVAKYFSGEFNLPINVNDLVFEFWPIFFGLLYFIFGFVLFVAIMLMAGAVFPSTKEASGFSSVLYLLPAVPFWAFSTVINQPDAILTQILSYFPLTAPTTLLLRNTVGNVGLLEATLGLGVIIVSSIGAIWLAGKLFRLGALNFSSRVKLSTIFSRS